MNPKAITSLVVAAVLSVGAFAGTMPKNATLIPAPREIRATGGEYLDKKPPKLEKVAGLPPEGYELSITTNGITIRHSDDAGAYYAQITLFHSGRWDSKAKCKVYPCLEIKDWPQFRWRGVHLDDSRRFFGKEAVLQLLKQMSWFKFNVLHWHLTDDQLWSLEIPGFPELQKYGAEWYINGPAKWRGEKVGPLYYTANDVKEILAYAKERHITVVPEIELPGHSAAAILAYPELYCFPKDVYSCNRDVFKFNRKKLYNNVYCFGNPDTFRFLEKVLDYVCEIFPSEVIHIGGDECSRGNWKACPKCQAFIKEKGLKGVEDIQPWVTRHFVDYLAKKGRRTIGWDEIFMSSDWTKWNTFMKVGGDSFSSLLPKTTMGMCWRSWGAGGRAANRGYEIVRCPGSHCYFDARQGLAEDPYYYFGSTVTTLEKVYRFDPYEGVEPAARKNVVGGQCCNWSTHTFCLEGLEWKMWPRGFALAEVLWTYPDPAKRDFKEFAERAANYRRRLIAAHVNCAPFQIAAVASPSSAGVNVEQGRRMGAAAIEPFPDGARVVFFGDSITQNGAAVTRVAAHYRKKFPKCNVRFFNVGISGGSVEAAHLYFDSWFAPLKPTHVVIGFGVNDAGAAVLKKDAKDRAAELKRIESVAAAFEKNYCKLLDRIEALGAKVILRTPTPYDEFTTGATADGKMRVNAQAGRNDAQRRIAESIRKVAAVRKLPLVDDFTTFSPWMNGEDALFEADRVHPNRLGLWRLARNLLSAQALGIEKFKPVEEVAGEAGLTAWREASVRLSNLLSAEWLIVRDESLDLDAKLAKVRSWLAKNENRKGCNPYVVARASQFLADKPREAELRADEEAAWGSCRSAR